MLDNLCLQPKDETRRVSKGFATSDMEANFRKKADGTVNINDS